MAGNIFTYLLTYIGLRQVKVKLPNTISNNELPSCLATTTTTSVSVKL